MSKEFKKIWNANKITIRLPKETLEAIDKSILGTEETRCSFIRNLIIENLNLESK
jgi:metal-responsive CopG/Arc/MetJ family transcriptional regulator